MKTLVCITAQTRAHEVTYQNFVKNLLEPLNADLLLVVQKTGKSDPFRERAILVEEHDEPEDFGEIIDSVSQNYGLKDWRQLLQVKDQWLGGIKGPGEHKGSAGILILYRHLLQQCLLKNGFLEGKYDWIIQTRSDHFFKYPHPPVEMFDRSAVWVPEGQDYGGITDRHWVMTPFLSLFALNLLIPMLTYPMQMRHQMLAMRDDWNLERYCKYLWEEKYGLTVRRFPRTFFTTRGEKDTSRWSAGSFHPPAGMIVKYRDEFEEAERNAAMLKRVGGWKGIAL